MHMPVIEDYEVATGDTSLKRNKKRVNPRQRAVRTLVFWILFLGVMFAISFAPISNALAETDFIERIGQAPTKRRASMTSEVEAWFAAPSDRGAFTLKAFPATVLSTGVDKAHDLVECLIAGSSTEAAKAGYISLFPTATKLNGLTVSCSCAFADLSSAFLQTEKLWGPDAIEVAALQIKLTLRSAGLDIDEVVILVDGVETYCF